MRKRAEMGGVVRGWSVIFCARGDWEGAAALMAVARLTDMNRIQLLLYDSLYQYSGLIMELNWVGPVDKS